MILRTTTNAFSFLVVSLARAVEIHKDPYLSSTINLILDTPIFKRKKNHSHFTIRHNMCAYTQTRTGILGLLCRMLMRKCEAFKKGKIGCCKRDGTGTFVEWRRRKWVLPVFGHWEKAAWKATTIFITLMCRVFFWRKYNADKKRLLPTELKRWNRISLEKTRPTQRDVMACPSAALYERRLDTFWTCCCCLPFR